MLLGLENCFEDDHLWKQRVFMSFKKPFKLYDLVFQFIIISTIVTTALTNYSRRQKQNSMQARVFYQTKLSVTFHLFLISPD